MRTQNHHRLVAALALSALLASPAQARLLTYAIAVGPYGSGSATFDAAAVVWGTGDHADGGVVGLADFTAFNFSFDGTNFTLADVTGQGAWFYGDNLTPEPDLFAGLELGGTRNGDSIAFTPGFGLDPNDLGLFNGIGNLGGDTGPIALTTQNLTLVPEPEPWLVSLLAFAVGLKVRARRWGHR
ncbi:hypothetical protein [Candidatus Thiodictyon syntrophicum]|jgi:hypothetical protein|uniref:PEP-CTERM protein-sorting domain-containing protein n=1 Tax=Candidatus Thiodictyon syntrophicum TaxID=1166950 RepID=A0A2K8U4B0_9GAMM|nr:hypothetical protein [Candidatus Thiodictyon syntrophicum]AUB80420.1 hypothetical protein THSYN_05290 [Candidatus Thiodictyon syntrophicum]